MPAGFSWSRPRRAGSRWRAASPRTRRSSAPGRGGRIHAAARKVNLLPAEIRNWLHEELKARGFAHYEALAQALNARLEEAGLELRIGKSAVHEYGREYAEFARHQEEASAWALSWMRDQGLEEEAQRHNVLFQMITTLAFKVMANQMTREGDEIDPRELHFLGKMLKDVMSSSGIREKLIAEERARAASAAREEAAQAVRKHGTRAGMTQETVDAVLAEILGVSK